MSNKHQIEESLKNLIDDDREFVAMLSGEWGIGKTYFWHEFTKKHLENKDVVYISLFGKNTLADIETEIVTKLYKFNKGLKRYTKHLDTVGNMASKALGLPINVSIGSLLSLFKASDFKNIVICFDDFERLSDKIPLKDVMGLISQFKEQKKCEVVMILNERELEKLSDIDGKKHSEIFALYKEKIVDYNFHYMPSQTELFDAIKEDIKGITFCKHQVIYNFFQESELKNIRIMKQSLYQLAHFDFIKDFSLNAKVVNEFTEIALSLFVFKVFSNYTYLEFDDMQTYAYEKMIEDISPTKKTTIDETIDRKETNEKHEKHEKFLDHYYYSPGKERNPYYSRNKDILEEIVYNFIDTNIIKKEKLKKELKDNNEYLERYEIKDRIQNLYARFWTDFSVQNNEIALQLYNILKEHKYMIHLYHYSDYRPIMERVRQFMTGIDTKDLEREIAKNYIEFYIDNPNIDAVGPFHEKGQLDLLISDYDWAKDYIEEYRNRQKITSEEILPIIKAILNRRFLEGDDFIKLNQLNTEDYKKQIRENPDFVQPLVKFLKMPDLNTRESKVLREKIIKSLQSLRQENNDYAWKVDKIFNAIGIGAKESTQ